MLKILLESFLLEIAENGLNADAEINYLYKTLNGNFITDLQKEIKATGTDIQQLKILAYSIANSEEFKEELSDLNITVECNNILETTYNEVINTLMSNDRNAAYDDILKEHNNDYTTAIHELFNCIESIIEELEMDTEEYDFYNNLNLKLWKLL